MQIGRVLGDQIFEQRLQDVMLRHALDDMRIEFLGVGTAAPVEDLQPIALAHERGRLAATGDKHQPRQRRERQLPDGTTIRFVTHGTDWILCQSSHMSTTCKPIAALRDDSCWVRRLRHAKFAI